MQTRITPYMLNLKMERNVFTTSLHWFEKWPIFQQLKENNLFQKVKNDKYGVVWNENIDLAGDELYYSGQKVE